VLGFAQQEGRRKGAHTWWWWVLVANERPRRRPGEGTDEDLGTWRRAAAVAQLPQPAGGSTRGAGTRLNRRSASLKGNESNWQTPNKHHYLNMTQTEEKVYWTPTTRGRLLTPNYETV
jgi:hypothetical protein